LMADSSVATRVVYWAARSAERWVVSKVEMKAASTVGSLAGCSVAPKADLSAEMRAD